MENTTSKGDDPAGGGRDAQISHSLSDTDDETLVIWTVAEHERTRISGCYLQHDTYYSYSICFHFSKGNTVQLFSLKFTKHTFHRF